MEVRSQLDTGWGEGLNRKGGGITEEGNIVDLVGIWGPVGTLVLEILEIQ